MTKETEKLIIKDYKNHIAVPEIMEKFSIHWRTVYRVLERNDVARDRGRYKFIFPEQKEQIINLYQNKFTIDEISQKVNICQPLISKLLKENDIPILDTRKAAQKYYFNEHFFDIIDTPEKAYFLGLMYADGNVSSSDNSVTIELQKKDKEILDKLNNILKNTKPLIYLKSKMVGIYQSQPIYRLQLISKYFKEMCFKVGLVPRKAAKIKWPSGIISGDLLNHFLRGYFDGDGCICFAPSCKRWIVHLCCKNEGFIDSIKEYLKTKGIDSNKQKGSGVFNMTIHRKDEQVKFINLIYKDSDLYLTRKYEKCQKRLVESRVII